MQDTALCKFCSIQSARSLELLSSKETKICDVLLRSRLYYDVRSKAILLSQAFTQFDMLEKCYPVEKIERFFKKAVS